MDNEQLLGELQQFLQELSVQVKFGKGYFTGGLCRYKDQKYLYVNKSQDLDQQIALIITEIKKLDLNGVDIKPTISRLLSEKETN